MPDNTSDISINMNDPEHQELNPKRNSNTSDFENSSQNQHPKTKKLKSSESILDRFFCESKQNPKKAMTWRMFT